MAGSRVAPLSQQKRPPCSLPLADADLSLDNANWTKGLQAMSDWIWSGHLSPAAFPNHLARFFLHIPGIFEQQLHFSTTLIFDHPSYCNGVQVSGFVDRVSRELAISLIAQLRRCWYTMTHHAILGRLTCRKLGLSAEQFADKWSKLIDHRRYPGVYTRVERAVLEFAAAFATNPKAYENRQYEELRAALAEDNRRRYAAEGAWLARLEAARRARAAALVAGLDREETQRTCRAAADAVTARMPDELNRRHVDAQVVELAFLCLQFVALSAVFSGLNVPDEDFLAGEMTRQLPETVIERINELNGLGAEGMPELVPPAVEVPFEEIVAGRVRVEPAALGDPRLARVPLQPYEGIERPAFQAAPDRDGGLSVGGVQVGVYGWSFGGHFPGSLPYALLNHPELARFEAPYSLPLLFNEDQWRNGVATAGFVSRRLKELVIQKVYRLARCRYGIEHHTMYFYNTCLDEYGVGRAPQ